MKEIIKLKDVWKVYKQDTPNPVFALKGFDVSIKEGDFVAIMGPSGSGKCITGDSIILNSGVPLEIKQIENKKTSVLALDREDYKIKLFNISGFYKRKVKNILEIQTTSGKKISVTEEHPFFTLDENGISEILAKNIKPGDFVATARKIKIKGRSQYLNSLQVLSTDKSLIIYNSVDLVKKIFKNLSVSKKGICKKFNFNKVTCGYWLKKNNIPLHKFKKIIEDSGEDIKNFENEIKLTALSSNKKIKIPLYTSPELMEFYGFLAGDGNLYCDGIKITNLDKNIRKRIRLLSKKLFDLKPTEPVSKRLNLNSRVLRFFFNRIFNVPLVKKANNIKLPKFIFKCTEKEIAGFIRGLFDCDSYVSNSKKEINITLASKQLIEQLKILLLRFSIQSRYSEKIKHVSKNKEKTSKLYYSLSLSGHKNLLVYKKHIGFNSEFKKKRLNKLLKIKQNTNVDVIPCGNLIRKIRRDSKIILPRYLHKKLWAYEFKKINPSREKLKKIISLFEKNKINASKLSKLLKSEIFWDKITSVKKLDREEDVYDITVPGANNFISNEFIIHNSTGMNLIGSLDVPTKGSIFLDKHDISHLDESDLAQVRGKKIGFIFQQFNLIPNLTAKENVMLPMIFQETDENERENRAAELLNLVELKDRMNHYPSELSGGQQQRVAIARALANDPEVVLADEPTGNLDTRTGEIVMKFLNKLNEEGKTIIIITHDPEIATKHAKKIYWIKDGKNEKVSEKIGGKWKEINIKKNEK